MSFPSRHPVLVASLTAGAALAVGVVVLRRTRVDLPLALDDLDHAGHSSDLDGDDLELTSHDGARLAVHVCGPDDGPVVVLAHCWTGSQHTWAPVTRRLLAKGCRVVRWDQRGHGRSVAGHKRHSVEGLADDLETVLRELDLRDVVLAGHSMGGMTIQALATHHRDVFHERTKGIVLIATAGHAVRNPVNGAALDLIAANRLERLFERPGTGRVLVRSSFGRSPKAGHVHATLADWLATPAHVRNEFLRAFAELDLREGNAAIDVPTQILVGSFDTLTPVFAARALHATIPGSTLRILPGKGHMLPYEAPDEVAGAILAAVHTPAAVRSTT